MTFIGVANTHGEKVLRILCGVLLVVQLEILEQYLFFQLTQIPFPSYWYYDLGNY